MHLYLVQHAEAVSKEEDAAQSLSERGLQNIAKIAKYASGLDLSESIALQKVEHIFHSNKIRAIQTAQVLDEYIKSKNGISEKDGLSPMDDPRIWFERISQIKKDIMLVGHLPHLSRLASLLLCGDMERNIIDFKNAGIVCLKKTDDNRWSLGWMIIPEMIK